MTIRVHLEVIDDEATEGVTFRRRCADGLDNVEADSDYFGNLKKFERHDNMADEPTRRQGKNE